MKADASLYSLQGFRFAAGNPMEIPTCQTVLLQRKYNSGTAFERFDTNLRIILEAVVHFSAAWYLPDFWFRIAVAIGFGAGFGKSIKSVVDAYCEARRAFCTTRSLARPGPKGGISELVDEILSIAVLSPIQPLASRVILWKEAEQQWPDTLAEILSSVTQPKVSQSTGKTEFKIRGLAALHQSPSLASGISAPLMGNTASTISNGSDHGSSSTRHQPQTGQSDASVHDDQNGTSKSAIVNRETSDAKPRKKKRKKDRKASFGSSQHDQSGTCVQEQENDASKPIFTDKESRDVQSSSKKRKKDRKASAISHHHDQSDVSIHEQQSVASKLSIADKEGRDTQSSTKQAHINAYFVRATESPEAPSTVATPRVSRRNSTHQDEHDNDGQSEMEIPESQLGASNAAAGFELDSGANLISNDQNWTEETSILHPDIKLEKTRDVQQQPPNAFPGEYAPLALIGKEATKRRSFLLGPNDEVIDLISSSEDERVPFYIDVGPSRKRQVELNNVASPNKRRAIERSVAEGSRPDCHDAHETDHNLSSVAPRGSQDHIVRSHDDMPDYEPPLPTDNTMKALGAKSPGPDATSESRQTDHSSPIQSSEDRGEFNEDWGNEITLVNIAEKTSSPTKSTPATPANAVVNADLAVTIPESGRPKDLSSKSNVVVHKGDHLGQSDLASRVTHVESFIQALVKELNETRQTLDATTKPSNERNVEARWAQDRERIDKLEAKLKDLQGRIFQSSGTSSNGPPTPGSESVSGISHLQYLRSLDVKPLIAAVNQEMLRIRVVMKSKLMELPDKPTTDEGWRKQYALGEVMWALDEARAKADKATQKWL